jgi:prolyl-tRNA editing enzyme YbaK/EbsC (Cys-tRNA(Pro) deacylase)
MASANNTQFQKAKVLYNLDQLFAFPSQGRAWYSSFMSKPLSESAQRVQDALIRLGVTCEVVELPGSTRTAQEAAQAVGCRVEQIAKSLVFQGKTTNRPLLVVASGANRVNEQKLRDLLSEPVRKADAEFVREHTGFAIGGVPPAGLSQPMDIFIDEDLFKYEEIWAAAGTPHAVFKLTAEDLVKITQGRVVKIA